MNNDLKNELQKLLLAYPELLHKQLNFAEGDINISEINNNIGNEKKYCDPLVTQPDSILGSMKKIEMRKSKVHGYGIFANEIIEAGAIIEQCRLLKLGRRSKYFEDPVLKDYVWGNNKCKCDECIKHGNVNYLALGYGSVYNHSDAPNTSVKLSFSEETLTVTAKQTIQEGEEIVVTYGNKYWLIRDFWKMVHANDGIAKHMNQIKEEGKKTDINSLHKG